MLSATYDQLASRVQARLANDSGFEPLGSDPDAIRRFSDHDLASLVETRYGATVDPNALDDVTRQAWLDRDTLRRDLSAPVEDGLCC